MIRSSSREIPDPSSIGLVTKSPHRNYIIVKRELVERSIRIAALGNCFMRLRCKGTGSWIRLGRVAGVDTLARVKSWRGQDCGEAALHRVTYEEKRPVRDR